MVICRHIEMLAVHVLWPPQVDSNDQDNYERVVELWFLFCMIWSICCSVDESGRKVIDNLIRETEGTIPTKDTVYEYYVDPKNRSWVHWEDKLRGGWKYNPAYVYQLLSFFDMFVCQQETVTVLMQNV